MQTLSIDIETYSSVDLSKCGVYKYAEAADFDILLFGYSVDGGPVQVVDLACGEAIPQEIIATLTDDAVTKSAFNAQFERICLSRWLRDHGWFNNTGYSIPEDTVGNYLDPAAWKCTMIWSAYMGLPLSLEGVGAVLGLGKQKLTEGKELIKYFCQPCAPTKANGGRTRNLPRHAPDKWEAFKRYNVRDVEVEMFQFYGANRTGRWAGRIIQMQNLPQNHLPDLAEARGLVRSGDFDGVELLYEDVPDTLSQLIRTAFIAKPGYKFIVADFSAIEARVLAWFAGEIWRQEVFANGGDIYCASASQMFKVPVEKHGVNGHLRQKGKIAELALGYGGSVGALKAMGALDMGLSEDELLPLVTAWRNSNPNIVKFWWEIDRAAMNAVKYHMDGEVCGARFCYQSGMLFITLPSGRRLSYVKPRLGTNQFGSECITYEGIGSTKKWERLETYGPKLVENIVQATARDILCYAMRTLSHCFITMHIHDELVIEADPRMSLASVCEQMGRTPPWADGLQLRADGYETPFYKKD